MFPPFAAALEALMIVEVPKISRSAVAIFLLFLFFVICHAALFFLFFLSTDINKD